MRVDLHCHSKFSKKPSLWLMEKIGCPESFTEPKSVYHILKSMGMTAVTITDHDQIEGCLEIAEFPDTFISEEVTAAFPEDQCKLHVLVFHINEVQHQELQQLRENVYDLVRYLNQENIAHALAHPLFKVSEYYDLKHLEKLLLLFKVLEINGGESGYVNEDLRRILQLITPARIANLADKHNLAPIGPEPWVKYCIGGSDDHSSLHLARAFTDVADAENWPAFWDGVQNGRASVTEHPGTPPMLAHFMYGTAYQFYKGKFKLDQYVNQDLFLRFLDRALQRGPWTEESLMDRFWFRWGQYMRYKPDPGGPLSLLNLLRWEASEAVLQNPDLLEYTQHSTGYDETMEQKWFALVNQVSNRVLMEFGSQLLDKLVNAHIFDVFSGIGSAGALYFMLAPFFVAFSLHKQGRDFGEAVRKRFEGIPSIPDIRIAHFTDTYNAINGAALRVQRQARLARETQKPYIVITCAPEGLTEEENVHRFTPVGEYAIPDYPDQRLWFPPFLEMLNYCYEQNFTHIHVSTPGPVGLAALAIARILRLPIYCTYYTSFPAYMHYAVADSYVEELLWNALFWIYSQMDRIYVPSKAALATLKQRGLPKEKLHLLPRGVDLELFHPSKRKPIPDASEETIHILYVGRVSQEKNLPLLAEAFRALTKDTPQAHLIIAGRGPYRDAMQDLLKETPCTFLDAMTDEELATLYASCDMFVHPAAADTFADVVLEAQASGLPVIVSVSGGADELVVPFETGLIVPGDDAAKLEEAMRKLATDPLRRRGMGQTARQYMERRPLAKAFSEWWGLLENPA